jgi:E2F-associated phosphoprotein
MLVMNICVLWDEKLVYDERKKGLVEYHQHGDNNNEYCSIATAAVKTSAPTAATLSRLLSNKVVPPDHMDHNPTVYYTVCCANCQTQVAALDMTDEVYHFYGCLASS